MAANDMNNEGGNECECCGCDWFRWQEPTFSAAAFYGQVSILAGGSFWDSAGAFVRRGGSASGGTAGRVLLNGSAATEEYSVTVVFNSLPSGSGDTLIRIYLDCAGT